MYLFQNGTWVALPTYATGIKNGRVLYRAGSPEFSLFAITINNTPFSQTQESAFTISPEPDSLPKNKMASQGVPVFTNLPVSAYHTRNISTRTTRFSLFFPESW